jgi:hypothetical protein
MKTVLLALLTSSLLSALSTPAMRLDPQLDESAAMAVKGRQGWQIKQVITFGEYRSGPVKRSWTKGYDYPFTIRFTAAKEKLTFATQDGSGRRAELLCAGKLSEQDFHKLEKYFDINLRTKDVFSCAVIVDETQSHEFFVHDLNQNSTSGDVEGRIHGAGIDIEIRAVWKLANGKKSWDTRPPGLEFVRNGTVVGAVETLNKGRVWLDENLDANERLVLAGIASALLLRSDLADHND